MSSRGRRQPAFLDRYLAGEVRGDQIDDFVDAWHCEPQSQALAAYLGMTEEEYALWVRNPDALPDIAQARQARKRPIDIVAGK